jgi:hypothetical protein
MPRKPEFDTSRLNRILQEQHSVVSRAQVFACGMSRTAVQVRIAPSGPWQRVLPGVYLAVTVADGVRSVAEADFRVLILRSDLPRPVFNARLIDVNGTLIAALHFSPKRVKGDPAGILREIRQAIGKGLERPPLPIKGLPPDG